MTNLVQLQGMLEGLSDGQLRQSLSNNSGSVPQILLMMEVDRRQQLRQGAGPQGPNPKPSMLQQMQSGQYQPVPTPPMSPPPTQQGQGQGQAPGYSKGGLIRDLLPIQELAETMKNPMAAMSFAQDRTKSQMGGLTPLSDLAPAQGLKPAPTLPGLDQLQSPQVPGYWRGGRVSSNIEDRRNDGTKEWQFGEGNNINKATHGLPVPDNSVYDRLDNFIRRYNHLASGTRMTAQHGAQASQGDGALPFPAPKPLPESPSKGGIEDLLKQTPSRLNEFPDFVFPWDVMPSINPMLAYP